MKLLTLDRTKIIKVSEKYLSLNFYYSIGLIYDCYDSVKFLNKLPLGVLEESIHIFRKNLFSMADRKQIPNKIY